MFAFPGLALLLVFVSFKPQEFIPALEGLPLLYAFVALAALGFLVDLRLGLARATAAPQLGLAVLFVGWCLVSAAPRGAAVLGAQVVGVLVPFALLLLVGHVIQGFRALHAAMGIVLAIGVSIAVIGVHQGLAPLGCHRIVYSGTDRGAVFDGRPCTEEDPRVCYGGDAEPGIEYACERVGLLGTQTVAGRVRFRGTMRDPNELALAVAIMVPFAFAVYDRRRSLPSLALLAAALVLAATCAVFTRSRGGQLVFVVVLGVYFLRKLGRRGLVAGAVGAVPVLFLGGRASAEASASSLERVEAWAAGLRMFQGSPILGVGPGQFSEHHYLTAHNSYVLTLAELGLPGMMLWVALLWLSVKIPLRAVRAAAEEGVPRAAASSALALLAAMAGLAVGMLFLSYAYKELLWIHFGLSAALHQAIRRHAPGFRVSFGLADAGGVAAACVALAAATLVFTRLA